MEVWYRHHISENSGSAVHELNNELLRRVWQEIHFNASDTDIEYTSRKLKGFLSMDDD